LAIDVYCQRGLDVWYNELEAAHAGFDSSGFLGLFDQFRDQHSFTSLGNAGSQANVNERSSAKILHTPETSIEDGASRSGDYDAASL
jgi:hypothetical protein